MNPWEAAYPVSIEVAKKRIEREFPALAPLQIEPVGTGFDHTVYAVNDCLVFRFPRRELGLEAMKIENSILTQLDKADFQPPFEIPAPRYYGKGSEGDYPFVGFTYVKGHTLVEESNVDFLKDEAKKLALFLRKLHSIPVNSFVLEKDQLRRLSTCKRKPILKKILHEIAAAGYSSEISTAQHYAENLLEWENPPGNVIVHGDLHPKNLIVHKGKLHGIIDWGDAHIGHPASDISILYQCIPYEHHPIFFEHYGEIDDRTKQLAIFKAIFISAVLLRYAVDTDDKEVKLWGSAGLRRALQAWGMKNQT